MINYFNDLLNLFLKIKFETKHVHFENLKIKCTYCKKLGNYFSKLEW